MDFVKVIVQYRHDPRVVQLILVPDLPKEAPGMRSPLWNPRDLACNLGAVRRQGSPDYSKPPSAQPLLEHIWSNFRHSSPIWTRLSQPSGHVNGRSDDWCGLLSHQMGLLVSSEGMPPGSAQQTLVCCRAAHRFLHRSIAPATGVLDVRNPTRQCWKRVRAVELALNSR